MHRILNPRLTGAAFAAIFTTVAACASLLLTGGCAGSPDCNAAIAAAERAADQRQPLERWIGTVDARCRTAAETVWADALESDCEPLIAFHAARSGSAATADCSSPEFQEASSLGTLLGEMERERAGLEARLSDDSVTAEEARGLRQRLLVIERDQPQIEALARMQGFLPPAEIPAPPGT